MNTATDELSPAERWTLAAFAALSLLLRAVAYFRYRFDSDEPQHLHVAWGWTAGLVQYRDYFDNHAPLFHMLSAPLLAALGERPNILLYMRAPMQLLFAIVVLSTWVIARRFYSRRVAMWSVVLLSLFPSFFLKSLEYRTDNLWNTLWAIALLVVVGGSMSPLRAAATGAILGIAMCVSLKTVLLIASLALAAVGTRFAMRERLPWRDYAVTVLAFSAAFAVPPALLVWYFVRQSAWDDMLYCVVRFNEFVERTHPHAGLMRLGYPFLMALVLWWGRRIVARSTHHPSFRGRLHLGMLMAMFFVTLVSFWVLISPRDYLPMMPLMAIFTVSFMTTRPWSPARIRLALAGLAALFAVLISYYTDRFANHTDEQITMMNQVLKLTKPGEPLMDYKGETIYRRRPYYYIFELITRQAMYRGLIADTVAESVVRAGCHVVQADGEFWPMRSRRFLNANFLDVGRLRVSGQWLRSDGAFDIAVPGRYVFLDHDGEAAGDLDGRLYRGALFLAAGQHRFNDRKQKRVACVWAPAYERGFSPFHLKDRDF